MELDTAGIVYAEAKISRYFKKRLDYSHEILSFIVLLLFFFDFVLKIQGNTLLLMITQYGKKKENSSFWMGKLYNSYIM